MLKRTAIASVLALSAVLILMPESVSAQAPRALGCAPGLGQGYGFGVGVGLGAFSPGQSRSFHDRIPYFSLYPPVYYSDQIVRRPYGISPFAAPPGIRPIEMDYAVDAQPQVIENPFYEEKLKSPAEVGPIPAPEKQASSARKANSGSSVTGRVQIVENPHYVDRSLLTDNK